MKLSMLWETKSYADMTPEQRKRVKAYRAKSYKSDRRENGRAASGSNESNLTSVAKWRKAHPDMYKAHNKVNARVKSGELAPVKPGNARHHCSYCGKNGGKFKEVPTALNARKANEKRSGV